MLIEQGKKAYISDEVVEGKVIKATQYIFNISSGQYTRVGDSVKIKGKYKEIGVHNIKARYSFEAEADTEAVDPPKEDDTPEIEEEVETDAQVTDEEVEVTEEIVDDLETEESTETVEPKHEYTFMQLKTMNKQQQNAIAKELGLKGYHNLVEDDRIEMILNVK